jgi:hypothetical protein
MSVVLIASIRALVGGRGRSRKESCRRTRTSGPALCVLGLVDAPLGRKETVGERGRAIVLVPWKGGHQWEPHDPILRGDRGLGRREGDCLAVTGTEFRARHLEGMRYAILSCIPSGTCSAPIRASRRSSPRSRGLIAGEMAWADVAKFKCDDHSRRAAHASSLAAALASRTLPDAPRSWSACAMLQTRPLLHMR